MAIALEGVDLIVIALFIFLLAFLHATKWTVEPLVHALHSGLGWIPGVGGLVDRASSAVIGALNDAISGTETAISTLWAGFVWSLNELIDGLSWAWGELAGATEHAFTVSIPHALQTLRGEIAHAGTTVGKAAAGVEARIVDAVKEAEHYALTEANHAVTVAGRYVDAQLARYATAVGSIVADFDLRVRGVERDVAHALDVAGQAVAATGHDTVTTITRIVEAAGSPALAELVAAEQAVAGELPGLAGASWDDIEQLLRSREFGTLAGLLAAVPLVNALVHVLAAETGLTNAECRQKVRGVCATDPGRWAHLLEGLAFAFVWDGLDAFADAVVEITDEVSGVIVDLCGLG